MTMTIQGIEPLKRKLANLPKKVRGSITRKALRAGASVFREKIRSTSPVDTGALKRSIKIRMRRGTATVAPDKNYERKGRRPVKYAHLQEDATKFFSSAVTQSTDRAQTALTDVLRTEVTAAAVTG